MRAGLVSIGIVLALGGGPLAAWGFGFGGGGGGGFGGGPGGFRGPQILRVDVSGRSCPGARFTRIQDAIDAARAGATIMVCAGTYPEQLIISKRVRVIGTGRPIVQPAGMTANTTSLRTGAPITAAAVVTAGATIDGFEFDLSQNGLASCDGTVLVGVFFRGTSGGIRNSRIHGIEYDPAAGACDDGTGVLVQGNGTSPTRVDVSRNVVYDYQRAGIVVNERGARGMILGNTVTGNGVTSDTVQSGIQVGFGATATVSTNVVQNNAGPSGPNCTFDAGNLVFQANGGFISGNTFTGNTSGIIINGSSNRMLRNTIDGLSGGVAAGLDGISVFGDRNFVTGNTVRNVSEVGIRLSGNANVAIRNVVNDTHAATLCASLRALPGCTDVLAVCGVGLWVVDGTGNISTRNALNNNDVALRNDGQLTVHRPGR